MASTLGDAPTHDADDDDTVLNDDISSAYREIVVTPSDVLLGRGSFVNEHTGNRQFRIFALKRKAEFDEANPPARRDIAADLVNMTKDLDPPGRFLKRAPYALQEPVLLTDGKYQLPPRGLEGPWEAITLEQQWAKAMQVMRDLKPKIGDAPTHDAYDDDTVLNDDISSAYREIVVTPSDVLMGRGSFINEHTGNRQFRILALKRKAEFDEAIPPARRDIAADLVNMTKGLDPPGRFLKRAPYALQEPVLLPDGKYQLPPRGLEGPWEAITLEQQRAKAMQVMRDLKPKKADFVFEAEQVAALARVNASMKEKMVAEAEGAVEFARDTESEEAVAFARADNFIDAHHHVPGIPSMAEAGSDPLQGVNDDGIDHDIAEGHEEMPESPGMSQDGNDGIQVAEDEMKEAVVDDIHDEMSEPPAESEGTSYHLQVDEGETENNVGRTYV